MAFEKMIDQRGWSYRSSHEIDRKVLKKLRAALTLES
jgi:hypothetical protein